jgi:hypothetical protein
MENLPTWTHSNILISWTTDTILNYKAISEQKLSVALLIFDEINRKGFEGDLLLNGLQNSYGIC